MNFSNPNTGAFVWSRTAGDILLTGGPSPNTPVQFTVLLNGSEVVNFELTAISGMITLRFKDILEALLPRNAMLSSGRSTRYSNTVAIRATVNEDSITTSTMVCFRGGSDELSPAYPYTTHWLTWKPQITDTWAWAKEQLSCIIGPSTPVTVSAKVYFAYHTPVTVTIATFASQSGASIGTVDCSPSVIEGLANVSNDALVAYDVYAGNVKRHRFILKPTRLRGREFLFRNSLGVWDTVYASGDVSRETEMGLSTVTINGEEVEFANAAVERFKVQTGSLRERRMMDQWQDFFRTTERYVLLQDDTPRRIVVDSIEPEMTEHTLSSATITYHYAKAFTGRYFNDTELDDYDYTATE